MAHVSDRQDSDEMSGLRWKINGNCLTLEGEVRELFDSDLASELLGKASAEADRILLDLGQVRYMNSMGILTLSRALTDVGMPVELLRIPEPLVRIMNCSNIFPPNVAFSSFYAPFRSEQDNTIAYQLLEIGKDVPLCEEYEAFDVASLPSFPGCRPAFTPEDYFGFLEEYFIVSREA